MRFGVDKDGEQERAEAKNVGYVDKSLWCFTCSADDRDQGMHHPFLEASDRDAPPPQHAMGAGSSEGLTEGHSVYYEASEGKPEAGAVAFVYVPSSPGRRMEE